MIPPLVRKAIDAHANDHKPCGAFVTAVLENNLSEALGRADSESRTALGEIVAYCHWDIPGNCWGSREHVRAWLDPKKI